MGILEQYLRKPVLRTGEQTTLRAPSAAAVVDYNRHRLGSGGKQAQDNGWEAVASQSNGRVGDDVPRICQF